MVLDLFPPKILELNHAIEVSRMVISVDFFMFTGRHAVIAD